MNISDLIPQSVKDFVNKVLDMTDNLLQGETVLVIGNGAAVIVYLVAKAVKAIPDVSFAEAVAQATAAEVLLNTLLLSMRRYVSSPKTAAALQAAIEAEHAFHSNDPLVVEATDPVVGIG